MTIGSRQYSEDLATLRINVTTMGDLLLSAADRHPDKLALVFPESRHTYAELAARLGGIDPRDPKVVSTFDEELTGGSADRGDVDLGAGIPEVAHLLGHEGQGVGIAERATQQALAYARERRQFGKRVADFEMIQAMLADMAMELEAARQLCYFACEVKGFDPLRFIEKKDVKKVDRFIQFAIDPDVDRQLTLGHQTKHVADTVIDVFGFKTCIF